MVKKSKNERVSQELTTEINYLVRKGFSRVAATRIIAKTFNKFRNRRKNA